MKTIEQRTVELDRALFYTGCGFSYDELTHCIISLANVVKDADEVDWFVNEDSGVSLDSLIVGAFWHYSEWHDGQYSDSYLALCALGSIYSPSMECGCDEDTPEHDVYMQLAEMAK